MDETSRNIVEGYGRIIENVLGDVVAEDKKRKLKLCFESFIRKAERAAREEDHDSKDA